MKRRINLIQHNGMESDFSNLPEHVKNYMIDIDGTITDDVPNEEPERMATCDLFLMP